MGLAVIPRLRSLLGIAEHNSAEKAKRRERAYRAPRPGWAFDVGLFLFSLSIAARAATGLASLAWVTPFGGVALLAGWAALAIDAVRRR
jgi:uncharacterized membrane protein YgdD (TMEM256/DUF423 family)